MIKFRMWPGGIIVAMVLFCSFMIGFTIFSTQNRNELVDTDYYAKELRYQEVITQKENLHQLEEEVVLRQEKGELLFSLPAVLQRADSGSVDFYRPNDQKRDFEISWADFAEAGFRIGNERLGTGRWVVTLKAYQAGTGYFSEHRINVE